jgi:uncharacterized protein
MKIRKQRELSPDLIDKRAETRAGAQRGLGIPGGAKGGIGGIVIMLILALLGGSQVLGGGGSSGSGIDIGDILGQLGAAPGQQGAGEAVPGAPDPQADQVAFVSFVLDDIQDFWEVQFERSGGTYQRAKLVLFERQVTTGGCGSAPSAVGPFYCPADNTAYLDLTFFEELANRLGFSGDFAQAYVIAHEIGHHVQNLTGVSSRVRSESQRNPGKANELSIRQELQADCFAGAWAYSVYQAGLLESGDIEEALGAAAAVGDDRIQGGSGQVINEETWTHGSSEQRVRWFRRGFETGDPGRCDTFSGGY